MYDEHVTDLRALVYIFRNKGFNEAGGWLTVRDDLRSQREDYGIKCIDHNLGWYYWFLNLVVLRVARQIAMVS